MVFVFRAGKAVAASRFEAGKLKDGKARLTDGIRKVIGPHVNKNAHM